MAFVKCILPATLGSSNPLAPGVSSRGTYCSSRSLVPSFCFFPNNPSLLRTKWNKLSASPRTAYRANAERQESGETLAADAFTKLKNVLLPITDGNPFLSEGTRQAAATTTSLAKKYGADITVVVIDDKPKQSIPEHDARLSSIRWHLSEGGFKEFKLMERLGEGKKPTAIIGEPSDRITPDSQLAGNRNV